MPSTNSQLNIPLWLAGCKDSIIFFFLAFTPSRVIVLILCSLVVGFAQAYGYAIINGGGYLTEGYLPILPSALASSLIVCIFLLFIDFLYSYWMQKQVQIEQTEEHSDLPSKQAVDQLAKQTTKHRVDHAAQHPSKLSRLIPLWKARHILVSGVVIFLIWLPWGIALFPGSMNWDTFYQITSWYNAGHPLYFIPWAPTESFIDNTFSDHHPIFDTFLFGLFAKGSDFLFGTWNYGVFAFVAVQAFVIAITLSTAIAYLRKLRVPIPICFGFLIFIALFPPLPIYAFTMLKDSLFCVFFIPWFLMFGALCLNPKQAFSTRREIAAFIILSILLCLSKKTGFYIALVGIIGIMLLCRKYWKVFLSTLVSMILVMQVILPCIIFPLFDVAPGGKQEMLGMLFQQTARYVNENTEDITPQEREIIDTVLGYDRLFVDYNPAWADPVKFLWNWKSTQEDLSAYYAVWIQQGLRHPDTYLEAILAVNAKYLCSSGEIESDIYLADEAHGCWDSLYYPAALTDFREMMLDFYNTLLTIPVLNWLFKAALYVFWLPVAFFYLVLAHKRTPLLSVCIVLFISLCACIIGPIYQTRYIIAFIYTAPILIGFLFAQEDATSQESN